MAPSIQPAKMKILQHDVNPDIFFSSLRTAPHGVLFLDYDGTLAPFHQERGRAMPYPGVTESLDALMKNGRTRVVIISGRWTKDLLPLLPMVHRPEIWGSHGLERLQPTGEYQLDTMDEASLHVLAEADTWEEEIKNLGGTFEHKPGCLAIHWRGLNPNNTEQIKKQISERWSDTPHASLSLRNFDGGMELRVQGKNKGVAVETVLNEMPPDSIAAYLGDDLTDEDAFQTLKGKGLAVLVRKEWRATAADLWLQPPEDLLNFLARWQEARNGG